ncbi:MAG TPA: hypothetical protein PLL71_12990 [Agriterribacter sp.]|nr:hypothetical protein [Agriterribacter sp.]
MMKGFLKIKTWSALVIAPVLIAVGAYHFATGNPEHARAWLMWGLISLVAGVLWLVVSGRQNQSNNKRE